MKEDENILIDIGDKDCVAIELCYYHRTCYKECTRFLSKSPANYDTIDSAYSTGRNTSGIVFAEDVSAGTVARACKLGTQKKVNLLNYLELL